MLNPPGYGGDPNRMIDIGLSGFGLGQICDDGSSVDPNSGMCGDGTFPCYPANFSGPMPAGSTLCANSQGQILSSVSPTPAGAPSGGNISATSIAQVIGAAGNAAGSAIMASNAPAGYVWNAASGRYVPAVAGAPGVVGAPGLSTTVGVSGSIMLPIIGLVVVAGLLMVLKK